MFYIPEEYLKGNNEVVPMTRRYPDLPRKVLKRDSDIVRKLVRCKDISDDVDLFFQTFMKEKDNLSPERYWELLRTVWVLCGTKERLPIFRKLFSSTKRSRYYFSTPEEAKRLRELPDPVIAYRAVNENEQDGISWTISKEYAEHYAKSYGNRKVVQRSFPKSAIFAFIERNKEEELIIL